MSKLLAAAGALALMVSASQACDYHKQHVTASADQEKQSVSMSTFDGTPPPVATEEPAAAKVCADGDKDCVPAQK